MYIYQGKLNWYNYAVGETFTIIFPKGVVRANDPVYIFTQWTKDASGVEKSKFFQTILVQDLKQLPKSTDVTFTLSGAWYNYAITTEQNYSKIKVEMTNQPVQTLPRVLDPMPFPKTILETLTHGVAFIEQAGYLTAQAQNRFAALDADFHKQTVLVETLKKDKQNLEGQITSLTGERNHARSEVDELNKHIKENNAAHQKKVDELLHAIKALENHDLKDHGDMNKLKEDISELHRKNMILNEKLTNAQIEKKRLDSQIKTLREQVAALESKRVALQNELNTQKAQNVSLRSEVLTLKRKLSESYDANGQLQKKFAASESELRDTKAKLTTALQRANKAEQDLKTTTEQRDQWKKDFNNTDGFYQKEKLKSQKLHNDYETAYHQVEDYQNTVEEWQRVARNKNIKGPEITKIDDKFMEIRNRV
ncbi:hypothetical protein FANTH_12763 [Fusarium anthophilum]|uniref:Uncharacterized protein n=1 Tax=Fusarium anthophilum TaxID=48485 RepID=A0A8H4YRM9_9HYPO|nr:hypothetical protein FANTH_12763 [Fusarium anthophilum]